jgi:GT2 family glycosyltransferase
VARPRVDVVVPFRGSPEALDELRAHLSALELSDGDTILVVDNTPGQSWRSGMDPSGVPVLAASGRQTPGYARNRGADVGSGEWVVFLDADTEPQPNLLDSYFEPQPKPETAVLAGGIIDEPVPADAPGPARYAFLRRTLSQDRTLEMGRDRTLEMGRDGPLQMAQFAFAQTANVACRRSAFEAVGGFREDIRAAEDADLSYRLKAAGWRIERREQAAVVHRNRRTLRPFIEQATLHGAGAAWLDRHYPGSFPARRRPGLIWWAVRTTTRGFLHAARSRNRDDWVRAAYEALWELSFEFGRSKSVEERAQPRRSTVAPR